MVPHPKPILATPNNPAVSATVGLGTNGAAGIHVSDDNGAEGLVKVIIGQGFTNSGSIALTFPNTPPSLFFEGDETFGALTQSTVGKVITVSWSNAKFVVTGKPIFINYQWSVYR